MPLFCPNCSKLMKRVDKPYYNVHKYCLDCHAKAEDNNKILDNRIDEFKQYVAEQLEESNDSFVSENGEVENWVGKLNVEKVDEFTKDVIKHL